jgi:hypothetical protein
VARMLWLRARLILASLGRSTPVSAERTRNGYYVGMTLAEEHHRKIAELTHAILDRAVAAYAAASAGA